MELSANDPRSCRDPTPVSRESFECRSVSYDSDDNISRRCVPTQTQIRQQLGAKLSEVFFEYVGNEGKAYLGLEPPLVGPDVTWINPDSRLCNNVRVTPVPDPRGLYLKVFTHETILELGEAYVGKLKNQFRLEMEEALRLKEKEMQKECIRQMDALALANANQTNLQCKKVVGTLMQHFDSCFNELVETVRYHLRKECQLRVEEERAEVAAYMLCILQDEVERRDLELCEEFHDILFNELNVLSARYIKQINDEREVAVQVMRDTVRTYEKMIQDLRVEMEMHNVVDVCRAITLERKACREAASQMAREMREREIEFINHIHELQSENCTLRKMATERLKRLMQWKTKVREILGEFQRYINFALKSVPAQAEFLLNMEQLMLKNYPEDSFLQPEDYLHYKNCLKGIKTPTEELPPPPKPVCSSETIPEFLVPQDHESNAGTPSYCEKEETKPAMTFDYDQFKEMLKQKYAADLKPPKPKKKLKTAVCLWKKRERPVTVSKSCELYRMMTIAGENEKEHLAPVDCFLSNRLEAVQRICADEPEFATAILGCSDK